MLKMRLKLEILGAGSCLLRRRANARNVSDTPYPTGEKHTIATFADQTRNVSYGVFGAVE